MSSQILAIYTAVETMTITVAGETPAIHGLETVKESYVTANLPIRLLLALGGNSQAQSAQFLTLGAGPTGGMQDVLWQLTDLLLWKPQAQGIGIRAVAEALVGYAGLYVDEVRANRDLLAVASVTNLRVEPGVYEYPAESGSFYFGVQSIMDIQELIP